VGASVVLVAERTTGPSSRKHKKLTTTKRNPASKKLMALLHGALAE